MRTPVFCLAHIECAEIARLLELFDIVISDRGMLGR